MRAFGLAELAVPATRLVYNNYRGSGLPSKGGMYEPAQRTNRRRTDRPGADRRHRADTTRAAAADRRESDPAAHLAASATAGLYTSASRQLLAAGRAAIPG